MASTSANSSSIQKCFTYEVFLSFRGEDTRKNFVDHLYDAFKRENIITYRDDEEIKKGERISDELIRSIQDSRFYIIVFSKNYASSSWCLDELVQIMECHKTDDHTACPVFYDVEPTEVRNQSGAVGEAFDKHKDKEAAGKWRQVLREAAGLAGWELKNTCDGHEAKFIKKIVKEISLKLRFVYPSNSPSFDGEYVGMETRVRDVISSLELGNKDVRMIGIKGMGGAGKTALANAVFDRIGFRFEGVSFLENVREKSKNPQFGLKWLQKKVLSEVLNDSQINVGGVSNFKRMMRRKKVLVVLDDVDHIDQLEALANELDWFKPGSRVLITTRDDQVLVAHGVPENLILPVNLLSYEEAKCLFNRRAFRGVRPAQCYEELAWEVVRYAAGLPLTIKVLGSQLCGKSEIEWKDTLERLKTIPLDETLKLLELSYDSLEEDRKEIFLDVACMLKGWKKEHAIRVLESCGFHAKSGLKVLEQKSLITLSSRHRYLGMHGRHIELSKRSLLWHEEEFDHYLGMHDHIEEMGKNIVRRLHKNEPYKLSHLWVKEEVDDILVNDKGTERTRCLRVRKVDPLILMKGLRKMKGLRFLEVILIGYDFSGEGSQYLQSDSECSLYLPDGLQYLRWDGYPFECLPQEFEANDLVGLEMEYSNMDQLWKGRNKKVLKKLRFLKLRYGKLRSLDIGLIPNLERLHLQDCNCLVELHSPAENFHLKYLQLHGSQLRSLDLEWAQNLGILEVTSDCLTEVCMPIKSHRLKSIVIGCSKLRTLNLTGAQTLKSLVLKNCEELVKLHMPVESHDLESIYIGCSKLETLNLAMARNLKLLDLRNCEYLVELHMPIEELERISIGHSKLRTLNLTGARTLKRLVLQNCEELVALHMPVESHDLESISIDCSKLETLNLVMARNLKLLDLQNCEYLVELHVPIEELERISIGHSKLRTLNLTGAQTLKSLVLQKCEELVELHMPVESHDLESINIGYSNLRTLNLTTTRNLKRLGVNNCEYLVELHMPIGEVEIISIGYSKLRTLDLMGVRNLKLLDLIKCEDLEELHMPNECHELESIYIGCSKCRSLNLTAARNLKSLDLENCEDLVELDMPIEELESISISCPKLRTLHLMGVRNLKRSGLIKCKDLVELDMPIKCHDIYIGCSNWRSLNLMAARNLKSLYLENCEDLAELRVPIEVLESISIGCYKSRTLNLMAAQNLKKLDLQSCEHLVELHMPIEELESISIGSSKLRTLNLMEARNLKSLDLKKCKDLVELHMPIESYELEILNIGCYKLRTLNLTGARNLKSLDLKKCKDLVELHMPIESYELEILNIGCYKLRTLNLTGARNLKSLDLKKCKDLVELHMPIESYELEILNIGCYKLRTLNLTGARNLKRLDLKNYGDLQEFHLPNIYELQVISIGNCSKLRTLDLKGAQNLMSLDLKNCKDLVELHMPNECLVLGCVKIECLELRSLNLMGARNLHRLYLRNCEDLIEVDMPVENHELEKIDICCSRLGTLSLGQSPNLMRLELHDCFNSVEIHVPFGRLSGRVMLKPVLACSLAELHLTARSSVICPLHPYTNLPTFDFECIYKEPLSSLSSIGSPRKRISSLENLKKLISFSNLCACRNLGSLSEIICVLKCLRKLTLEGSIPEVPKELDQLEFLEELTLMHTKITHLPDSICTLNHLKVLRLKSCQELQQLPMNLGRLECLEELHLTDCTSLENIPNSICEMNRLKRFHLIRCVGVKNLPREIGRLPCLKDMYIDGTGIIDLPESFFQLNGRMLVEGILYSNVAI